MQKESAEMKYMQNLLLSHTHPTDSARGLVEFSETNTWQANLWSAGCLVMKPKYLQRGQDRTDKGHEKQHLFDTYY